MKLTQGCKFLLVGDSITDADRVGNPAEGVSNLGQGYVQLIDAFLCSTYPELGIRVVNTGIGGNRVRDLDARWQTDVINQKPDWVSIMIGANDVWRQFDRYRQSEIHVLPDEYERTLDKLVKQTRPLVKGLILLTPFFLDLSKEDAMRRRMDEYGRIVKKIADTNKAISVDTQAHFDAVLRKMPAYGLSGDRVHPNKIGHMILTRAVLDAIDFDWTRKVS